MRKAKNFIRFSLNINFLALPSLNALVKILALITIGGFFAGDGSIAQWFDGYIPAADRFQTIKQSTINLQGYPSSKRS
jgi:hypothetical protein